MAVSIAAALEDSLRDHLPPAAVSRDTAAFSVDGLTPEIVVSPSTTVEVAAAVRCTKENRVALIPCTSIRADNSARSYRVFQIFQLRD